MTYRPTESQGSSASQAYFSGQIVLDYLISALNIGLGIFLIRLRPNDWAARLLALGMVGAAAVFNVQAQSAFAVVPDTISNLYDNFLFVSGLAYLYALVLFPDGKISLYWPKLRWLNLPLRVLYLGLLAVLGILVGRLLYGGDPVAALAFFGLVIPITGITAQAVRYRRAATLRERQQSQALVWALSLVLMVSLVFGWAVLLFNILRPSTSESIVDQLRGMAVIVVPFHCRNDPHRAPCGGRWFATRYGYRLGREPNARLWGAHAHPRGWLCGDRCDVAAGSGSADAWLRFRHSRPRRCWRRPCTAPSVRASS